MMHLHLGPQAPAWLAGPAVAVLVVHIGAGLTGLASGTVALATRKGDRWHRRAGTVFFVAMLAMAAAATFLASFIPQRSNLATGILTFYLVASAWMTVRRKAGALGRFEYAGLLAVLGASGLFATFGMQAANAPHGQLDGFPAAAYWIVAGLALLVAALDLKVILQGGISGAPRIARHLWRMCVALFFASGSFFLGQQQVLPVAWHGSPWLFVPALAPVAVMGFWLVRVRLPPWSRPAVATGRTQVLI